MEKQYNPGKHLKTRARWRNNFNPGKKFRNKDAMEEQFYTGKHLKTRVRWMNNFNPGKHLKTRVRWRNNLTRVNNSKQGCDGGTI